VQARVWAAAEIALLFGLILLDIWVVQPMDRPRLDLSVRLAVGALLVLSPWVHGDSPQRLGWRLDTLGPAVTRLLPGSLLVAVGATATGWFLGSIDPPESVALTLGTYLAWAVLQQCALQSVVLLRLEDAGLQAAAPLAAATLFAIAHAPNPGLLILTFLGGLLWCSTFRRHPNLFAVAISHAILAVVVVSTVPHEITGGLRIGPAYLEGR